jgi:Rod binding domain-containing protein
MVNVTLSPTSSASTANSAHEALLRQTRKWVGMTFYGTLLKQVRDEPFHSDTLDGGQGGKMFGAMLDQQLSTRMGNAGAGKLVNAIVNRIEQHKGLRSKSSAAAAYGAPTRNAPAGGSTSPKDSASEVPFVSPSGGPANKVNVYVAPGFGT